VYVSVCVCVCVVSVFCTCLLLLFNIVKMTVILVLQTNYSTKLDMFDQKMFNASEVSLK
jgi:hypothetical protein